MKKGCMWLQSDLETEEIEFLQKLPRPLLAEITISVVQDLLKGNANGEEGCHFLIPAQQERVRMNMLFTLMSFREVPRKYTLKHFLCNDGTDDGVPGHAKLAISLHMQILGLFWDKLFRGKDIERIRSIMIEQPGLSDLKPNAAYHSCAQLETQVVRAMLANFGQDGLQGSPMENRAAKAALDCKGLLGDKLQTYLKVGTAKKLWATVVAASKLCRTASSMLEDCKACLDTFPEALKSGSINEPLKLVLFCEQRQEAEKAVTAMNCEEAVAGLGSASELENPQVQSLREEVAAAKTVVNQFVDKVLQAAAAALRGSDSMQDTSVLSGLGRDGVFKTMWMLARAAKVQGWAALPESVADCGGRLLAELGSMLESTRAAKGDLSADSFAAAASAIFKIQTIRDLQSFVQGVKALLSLLKLAEAASDAAVTHSAEPMAWFRSLAMEGKHLAILQLTATQRARLGPAVEQQVRCIQKVESFKNPPDNAAGQIFRLPRWVSRDDVSEGIVCLSDLQAFLAKNGNTALPGLTEAVIALGAKATSSIQHVAEAIVKEKKLLVDLHGDCQRVEALLATVPVDVSGPSEFPEELSNIVAKHNKPDTDADGNQALSPLASAVASANNLKPLEDVASLYVGRWEDYKDAVKDDSLQPVSDALAMEPTSKSFNQGAFNLMACELLLRNRED
ncbi:unnamed protein product, partial [Symbiodinium sp. KB8]